jgi:hypothetical protein
MYVSFLHREVDKKICTLTPSILPSQRTRAAALGAADAATPRLKGPP